MAKKMTDLREALFDTLEKVRKGEMPLDRAQSIVIIGQTIINSANAETNFLKVANKDKDTGFMELENSNQEN